MSNSVQPHRRQPTRLLRPWDSPGKTTGEGCHCLLREMHISYYKLFFLSFPFVLELKHWIDFFSGNCGFFVGSMTFDLKNVLKYLFKVVLCLLGMISHHHDGGFAQSSSSSYAFPKHETPKTRFSCFFSLQIILILKRLKRKKILIRWQPKGAIFYLDVQPLQQFLKNRMKAISSVMWLSISSNWQAYFSFFPP